MAVDKLPFQDQKGSWSNPHCAAEGCNKSPVEIWTLDAGISLRTGGPIPREQNKQWSSFTYTPCSEHTNELLIFLLERGILLHDIKRVGRAKEIKDHQEEDLRRDQEIGRRK